MKQYEVEVKGLYSHGCYGKEHYFTLVLAADSCKDAESFADDVLYGMTYQEFFNLCIRDCYQNPHVQESFMNECKRIDLPDGKCRFQYIQHELTDKIGDARSFTFKARVFKG